MDLKQWKQKQALRMHTKSLNILCNEYKGYTVKVIF